MFDNLLPKEMPMSCINRNVGFAPVEVGFTRVEGRPEWAIPWLEDDPGLTIPQLWVGRMRRDAADALAYGCSGLLGIHWRTRVLGPNVSALAKAAWEQKPWNPYLGKEMPIPDPSNKEGREGGNISAYPNNPMADTEHDVLYQTVAYGMKAYRLKVPNGIYSVRLQLCEPHYGEAGKRVFGVTLQGRKVIDKLDVFAVVGKNRAIDYTFPGVEVANGMLEIQFDGIVEYPCIAAFVVEGDGVSRKVNCGGPAVEGYEADLPQSDIDSRPRDLPAGDFYLDWAKAEFGGAVAEPAAKIFTKLDGGPDLESAASARRICPGLRPGWAVPAASSPTTGRGAKSKPNTRLWMSWLPCVPRSSVRATWNASTTGSTRCDMSRRWDGSTAPGAGSTLRWRRSRSRRTKTSRGDSPATRPCPSARNSSNKWRRYTSSCWRRSPPRAAWGPSATGSSTCCRACSRSRARNWWRSSASLCPLTPNHRIPMRARHG